MKGHPIRDQIVNVWQAPEGQDSPRWIALFGDGNAFPIRFSAETERAVRDKAEAFRSDVVGKHEATYLARLAAMEKARLAKKPGKAA